MKKYIYSGILVVLFFLIITGIKVFYLQRSHFMLAEKYYSEANWKLAIREYDNAMHFYTPLSPYIRKSAEKLWQVGEMFEKQGKPDWANIAYGSIRSSFYASRSLYTPGKDWINKCDEKIADLNVRILIKEGSIKSEDADAEKKKHLYVMKYDRAPVPLWSVLSEIGFVGWIISVIFIIVKGFENNGKLRKKFALYGILLFILTFALWVVSLLKA